MLVSAGAWRRKVARLDRNRGSDQLQPIAWPGAPALRRAASAGGNWRTLVCAAAPEGG